MKKQSPAWLILAMIMLVAAFFLAGTNMITKGVIEEQAAQAKEQARKAVLTEAEAFEEVALADGAPLDSLFVGKKGDEVVGYVGAVTVKGYGGPVEVTTGMQADGTITGLNVGGSSFAETAGLGAKAKEPAFMAQFAGKKTPVKVVKEGDAKNEKTVDAITAATITSSAVARGVNSIAKFVDAYAHPAGENTGAFTPGTATAAADGFGGPVQVEVTFDENKTITAAKIGDERFAETEGFGAAALEPEFAKMLVGKKAPLELKDIDAISGATITSQAVVDAVNAALAQLSSPQAKFEAGEGVGSADGFGGPVAVKIVFDENAVITAVTIGDERFAETEGFGAAALEPEFAKKLVGKKAPLELKDIDAISGATITSEAVVDAINKAYESRMSAALAAAKFEAGEGVGSADGFGGPVAVKVVFDENAVITAVTIGDDKFAETEGFGAAALEPEFAKKLVGKKAPLELKDIDAISGATITSEAVVDAINKAYESRMRAAPAEKKAEPKAETKEEMKLEAKEEKKAVPESDMPEGGIIVSKDGFAGPVAVTVWFEDDGATIKRVKIGDENFAETENFGAGALEEGFMKQFAGKKAPLELKDIDAISGATITSQAVVDAINDAVKAK